MSSVSACLATCLFSNFDKFSLIILRDEPAPTFRTRIIFGTFLSFVLWGNID